ncbi:MAG: hypothetical protein LJE65_10815 [Desulfobacteraceae bacterium]|nr:hypothetical protein [Desulfobacteraceae bacterium]
MDPHRALESLQRLILENELPRKDMALFGVSCPYCGKSDRIRPLEPPDTLSLSGEDQAGYEQLWRQLAPPEMGLGVCKFCQNPVALGANGDARSLLPE